MFCKYGFQRQIPIYNSRSVAHTLHSTSSDDRLVAARDGLRTDHDCFQTTSADLVDGSRVTVFTEAGTKGDLTRRRLANASLYNIAKVNFLDLSWRYAAGLKSMFQSDNTELGCSERFQGAIEGANRGAGGGDDHNFVSRGRLNRNKT